METIIFDSHFLHEFKAGIHLILGSLHLIGITVPREFLCSAAKLVTALGTQRMPPCHSKLQPVFHLLAVNYLFSIIITERHRVLTFLTFKFNLSYTGKILFCSHNSLLILITCSNLSTIFFSTRRRIAISLSEGP